MGKHDDDSREGLWVWGSLGLRALGLDVGLGSPSLIIFDSRLKSLNPKS